MRWILGHVSDGRFWMILWLVMFGIILLWGVATFIWFLDSIENLSALSVVTAILAPAAGIQATLSMRKADKDDPF